MWCLNGNTDIEAHEGDFRTIPGVGKRLAEADVVVSRLLLYVMLKALTIQLVNNEVFPSSLNIDLTNMFLDLKDGAQIISLKPFVPEGFRINESNVRHTHTLDTCFQRSNEYSVTLLPLLSSSLRTIMPRAG
jgi:H3 lysine-79-specific histone-lysine N-methyltransferase